MADSEQAAPVVNDVDTTETGDVQVEDAHPQIPDTDKSGIPPVTHQEPDSATTTTTEKQDASKEEKKQYPGGERFDPAALPQTDDATEIRKQVEFYFSDSNLTTDKFLYTMVSENAGWADLRSVANFKRMRRFQPFTAVVAALRESKELEVDEKGERVKRVNELKPFSANNSPVSRSVYVKGFGEETKTLQIDLEKFFETFGTVKVVRLRRTDDGQFKGSVFVEFATLEEQGAFLQKSNAGEEKLTYEGVTLEAMSKKAYLDMKEQQYGGKFPQQNGKKTFNAFSKENQKARGASNGRGGRGRGRGRGSSSRGDRGGDRNAERQENNDGEEKRGEKRAAEDAPTESATKVAKTE